MILNVGFPNFSGEVKSEAKIDVNYTGKTWSASYGTGNWPSILFSDSGTFEQKNGSIWLMDGPGPDKNRNIVILDNAPTGELDASKPSGKGRVVDPEIADFREKKLDWRMLRRTPTTNGQTLTKVRQRAWEICVALLPPKGTLSNGKNTTGASGTGCGEFPGRMLRRMPCKVRGMRGAFSIQLSNGDTAYLNDPITQWEDFALQVEKKHKPAKPLWIKFDGKNRPKLGDIYTLAMYDARNMFQHVGVILSADGSDWLTADGGQGNGWQSGIMSRKFKPDGEIEGEQGKKAWVHGWVDLDCLYEIARSSFPDFS